MILYPRFGVDAGNLGNQLFQLASMIGMEKRYKVPFYIPTWKYSNYFINPPHQYLRADDDIFFANVEEQHFHHDWEQWDKYQEFFKHKNIAIFGWLQSHKYWEHAKDEVRDALTFTKEFVSATYTKMNSKLKGGYSKDAIVISVRQGDYRNNENYQLLPAKYYIGALEEHFPDWRERELIFFSDDFDYCRIHFGCLENASFMEGLSDIEQLYTMHLHNNFILANSTFSYWGAMLACLKWSDEKKVVRPHKYFDGPLAQTCDEKDFWPEEWISYDHTEWEYLADAVVTIPVAYDSKQRRENLDLSLSNLYSNFFISICIGEQGPFKRFEDASMEETVADYYHFEDMKVFHRTKMLNDMCTWYSHRDIIINWDADVFIPPMQLIEAIRMIHKDKADMVYPYDGRFARVPRSFLHQIKKYNDIGILSGHRFSGMGDQDAKSVGGVIVWNRKKFIEIGKENENFVSYGPEDVERYERASKLGLRIARIPGALYHLDHIASMDSGTTHPHYKQNVAELKKVQAMTADELREYIKTWSWAQPF
jgi:hypothetical protein